jgi:hypothetical protein
MQTVSLIFNGVAVTVVWIYQKNNKTKSKTIIKRDVHLKSIESTRVIIIIVVVDHVTLGCVVLKKIMVIKNQKRNLI